MTEGAAQRENDLVSRIAVLEAELASVRRAHDHQAQARERAEHEREQYRKLYTLVLFELERLKRQLFGKKAESVDPNQVQLVFGPVFDALASCRAWRPRRAQRCRGRACEAESGGRGSERSESSRW
jgi:hypothetical protein